MDADEDGGYAHPSLNDANNCLQGDGCDQQNAHAALPTRKHVSLGTKRQNQLQQREC